MKPSIQFLEKLVKDPKKIFDFYINKENNKRKGKRPINAYFNNDNTNELDLSNKISCFNEVKHLPIKRKIRRKAKKKKIIKNPKPIYDSERDGFVLD